MPALTLLVVLGAVIALRPAPAPSVVGSPSPPPAVSSSTGVASDLVDTDAGVLDTAHAVATIEELQGRFMGTDDGKLGEVVVAPSPRSAAPGLTSNPFPFLRLSWSASGSPPQRGAGR